MASQKITPNNAALNRKTPRAVANILPADTLSALSTLERLVGSATGVIQILQTESTKREKLKTYRETEVARIRSEAKALGRYLDGVFEERSETSNRLFRSLDLALESGDVAAIQVIVGAIVDVAQTSPLADIGNLVDLRRAMNDPKAIFEL